MIEVFGNNPTSKLYYDNAIIVSKIWAKEYKNMVDLVYIDPPNMSGSSYKLVQKIGLNQGRITHSQALDVPKSKKEYYDTLESIIKNCKQLLTNSGNIFIHVNFKTSAKIKIMMDKLFGASNFVNEIIWTCDQGGMATNRFSNSHHTILFYRKSSNSYFKPIASGTLRGEKYKNHMKKNTSSDGRIYYSKEVDGKVYKYYEDDTLYVGDVWNDIHNHTVDDRNKFDGEKPKMLLSRIIECACPHGGFVCDPFCGSGAMGTVASESNRDFLMCDNSFSAINLSKTNIAQTKKSFEVVWGDNISIVNTMPKVSFSTHNKTGNCAAHLDDYRIAGGKKYYSNTLLPTEDTLVDNWSVGRLIDDTYYVDDFDSRTHDKPALGKWLILNNKKGKPCTLTVDVFANQVLHKISKI